jgi:Zn-dependent protease
MDRPGFVEPEQPPELQRDYEPVHARGFDWRKLGRRIWAPIAFIGGLAIKFGFVFVKFLGLFVSVAAYALLGGWRWGLGLVALILVHELGHYFEARRQGLRPSLPMFVPFFGAYVTIKHAGLTPWRSALIAIAGPFVGGLGAVVCWVVASANDSQLWFTLAYTGFFLNLFNLIPIGFLDGGAIARAFTEAWRMPVIQFEGGVPVRAFAPDRTRAYVIATMYLALVIALIYGMFETHVAQNRL